jgi:hypothetical protein
MKPQLIDYRILEQELSHNKYNKTSYNLNIILTILFIIILFGFLYFKRQQKINNLATNNTRMNSLLGVINRLEEQKTLVAIPRKLTISNENKVNDFEFTESDDSKWF